MKIRIGTRGSKLALWQANYVSAILNKEDLDTEIIIIETKGDKILDKSLSKIGSKGVFTEELENQLRGNKIDIAVHSAKDVQSSLSDDLEIIAFTEREKTNDVLLSLNKEFEITANSIIGTSSTRRRAQLRNLYPGLELVEMRGNLQTRLEKLRNGVADAMVLAFAGVHRMEMEKYIVREFSMQDLTPAAGQGSVAVQSSIYLNEELRYLISKSVNHEQTNYCISAERSFLKEMEGGCSIPIFCNAILEQDVLTINGGIISLDGKQVIKKTLTSKKEDFKAIGIQLASEIKKQGAGELLNKIKLELNHE